MTPAEAAALLTIAASFDNRKPDADAARAWSIALEDLRFEDCRDAVVAHYRRSREWLMPVEVVTGVKAIRRERLLRAEPIVPPGDLDDEAERVWMLDARRRIGDGEDPEQFRRPTGNRALPESTRAGTSLPDRERAELRAALRRQAASKKAEPSYDPAPQMREPELEQDDA